MQVITDTELPEIDKLHEAIKRLRDNQFIKSAYIERIRQWEQLLRIKPDTVNQTLEQRREVISLRLQTRTPLNMFWLVNFLANATGDNFDIVPNFKEFELTIILFDTRHIDIGLVNLMRFLRHTLPVNLVINYQNQIPYINGNINIGAALTQTVKITIPADYEAQVSYDIKGTLNTGTTLTQALTITI